MKRSPTNLKKWKECIKAVYKRASGVCEVIVNGKRCGIFHNFEDVGYINFAHKESRNGQTDEDVIDPANVIFSCAEHHTAEHMQGEEIESVEYEDGECVYIPDEQ